MQHSGFSRREKSQKDKEIRNNENNKIKRSPAVCVCVFNAWVN